MKDCHFEEQTTTNTHTQHQSMLWLKIGKSERASSFAYAITLHAHKRIERYPVLATWYSIVMMLLSFEANATSTSNSKTIACYSLRCFVFLNENSIFCVVVFCFFFFVFFNFFAVWRVVIFKLPANAMSKRLQTLCLLYDESLLNTKT